MIYKNVDYWLYDTAGVPWLHDESSFWY